MPQFGVMTESRNATFQRLRPICIALSQAAYALSTAKEKVEEVNDHLIELHDVLKEDCTGVPGTGLDAKLADYVFFPVSQVLKSSQKATIRCLELCIECVIVLVQQGWRHDIAPALAAQLMILCTLLAQDQPKGFAFTQSTADLQTSAYACIDAVSSVVDPEARSLLAAETNFPQLGQTISVILDGIHDGRSPGVQLAAAKALSSLLRRVLNRELCAGFMPGIISKLTRVLSPTTKQRRNPAVLIDCLDNLTFMVRTILNDKDDESETSGNIASSPRQQNAKQQGLITAEWKQSAATQMKAALTPVMRLTAHTRSDVKAGLGRLCLVILRESPQSLESCASMALSTALTLTLDHDEVLSTSQIRDVVRADVSLIGLLQTTTYQWLESLTTVVQSADGQAKVLCLERLRAAHRLLVEAGSNTGVLDGLLASGLRDAVSVTLSVSADKAQHVSPVLPVSLMDVALSSHDRTESAHLLVKHKGQEETMRAINELVCVISTTDNPSSFIANIARDLQASQGQAQLANFWLLLTATTATIRRRNVVDEYVDFDGDESNMTNDFLDQLYNFSLSILIETANESADLRVQALALRTCALQAQVAGEDFRHELIDTLYPVLHSLATPDEQLQQESLATLNVFAASCRYDSVQQLIVQNVDYLTNTIALKLNAFDVSPQAAQVLLMMVKLAGPSLLPYLEDTIDSIFAVLENYHGYPLLVELLFKVLQVVVQEGARTPQLAIGDSNSSGSRSILLEKWHAITMSELRDRVSESMKEDRETACAEVVTREPHPQRPWKETSKDETGFEDDEEADAEDEALNIEDPEVPPPAPRSYALLLKVADLTQHFLPSASATLRSSLLALIKTAIPALALHENSFLPLINTLWPEVVSRLDDQETHVQAMALEIIGLLCENAGSFMRSRITSLWPRIVELHHEIAISITTAVQISDSSAKHSNHGAVPATQLERAVAKMQHSPADYSNTSVRLIWDALIVMLTSVIQNVEVEPEIFDQAMVMLTPSLEDKSVWSALEQQNTDALWLARMRSGKIKMPNAPLAPDTVCWHFVAV